MANKLEGYVIPYAKEPLENEEDLDVTVYFDGFRIVLDFEDGGKCYIIFDQLLCALNRAADKAEWKEQAVEELEKLLKSAQKK